VRASIVIPTYNRREDLEKVLDALQRQVAEMPQAVEVVVVDDGSSDGTWQWLQARRRRQSLVTLCQDNAGPARARNRGVAAARGDLVLFLGDDTVPHSQWLATHLEQQRLARGSGEVAVVGYTCFPPEQDSAFRFFINEFGAQFGYLLIRSSHEVAFNFFYTSNISLPRRTFTRLGGFREDFPAAAWEDIEFAYRAQRSGLRIVYQPRARVVHEHRVTIGSFCRRQRVSGASAVIFAQLHPELSDFLGLGLASAPAPLSFLRQLLLRGAVGLGEQVRGVIPLGWYHQLLQLEYQRGIREAQQQAS